jgi:plastocyanin domain-containing protein
MIYRALLVGPLLLVGAAGAAPAAKPRTVAIAVTKEGFEPAEVTARRGEALKLVVTRKVERTCATEIVMKDFGVSLALPLDKPVSVVVTPKKAGAYRYACGMDMVAGVLKVD